MSLRNDNVRQTRHKGAPLYDCYLEKIFRTNVFASINNLKIWSRSTWLLSRVVKPLERIFWKGNYIQLNRYIRNICLFPCREFAKSISLLCLLQMTQMKDLQKRNGPFSVSLLGNCIAIAWKIANTCSITQSTKCEIDKDE